MSIGAQTKKLPITTMCALTIGILEKALHTNHERISMSDLPNGNSQTAFFFAFVFLFSRFFGFSRFLSSCLGGEATGKEECKETAHERSRSDTQLFQVATKLWVRLYHWFRFWAEPDKSDLDMPLRWNTLNTVSNHGLRGRPRRRRHSG